MRWASSTTFSSSAPTRGETSTSFSRHRGREGDGYDLAHPIKLPAESKEIDIEGVACEGREVYVVGSHARTRPKLAADWLPLQENRQLIAEIKHHRSREQIFHFQLDERGRPGPIRATSLRDVIEKSDVLAPFTRLPAKENGVDIEGIAVRDGLLFIGFRGPVLTGNLVPVLTCKFAEPIKTADVLFVELGGRGIRDLTSVKDGLLILAGPVGQGPGSFQLYFWDGRDCLPGKRDSGRAATCRRLCEVPEPSKGKPEGVALLKETTSHYELLDRPRRAEERRRAAVSTQQGEVNRGFARPLSSAGRASSSTQHSSALFRLALRSTCSSARDSGPQIGSRLGVTGPIRPCPLDQRPQLVVFGERCAAQRRKLPDRIRPRTRSLAGPAPAAAAPRSLLRPRTPSSPGPAARCSRLARANPPAACGENPTAPDRPARPRGSGCLRCGGPIARPGRSRSRGRARPAGRSPFPG